MRTHTLLFAVAIAATACSGTMQLLPRDGGAPANGTIDMSSKSMEVTLEGKRYAGNYVFGSATGFSPGGGFAMATGNNGTALLVAPDGDTIRCEFQGSTTHAVGVCQSRAGRVFDLRATRG